MMILAVRYSFLFWLTISESLLLRSMESDDQQIYRISACVARCLLDQQQQQFVLHEFKKQQQQHHENHLPESDNHSQGLEDCYHFCRGQNSTSIHLKDVRKIQENLKLELVCRDDRSLTFRIDSVDMSMTSATTTTTTTHRPALPTPGSGSHQSIEGKTPDIYVIKIHVARGAQEYSVYLTDDKLFTIDALKHNTTHIISAVVVHANNSYSVIAKAQQYRTLRVGYTPGMVQDIQVNRFHVNDRMWNDMRLTAEITWRPSADMTCHYNIICFSPESEEYGLTPLEIRNPRQLYSYNLVNLTFSSVYKIGIRAKNPNNIAKESELFWKTFEAPSCHEWFNNNFNICAPLQPKELEVEQMFLGDHEFSLNISWKQPEFYPDFYTLRVFDLTEDDNPYIVNVSKLQTSYLIPRILLQGFMYEVHLTAYTPGGNSTVEVTDLTKMLVVVPDKHHVTKLVSAILAPIFCFALLVFTTFIICYRRAKLKRYQERCKYFEDLEKKAPIDPKATFDFPTKPHLTLALRPVSVMDDMTQLQMDLEEKMLCFNDAMEIDRNDVALYEVLGEGAFGVVRRGLYQDVKLGPREVAVKMLKTQPTADDVHAFRREIEVMKSVEPHPNIVGIIGHCTKRVHEMLLLTEYCSFGNLLNFLRIEWKYMQEINVNGSYSNPLCSRAELKLSRDKPQQRQRQKQHPRIGDANRIKQKNITNNNNNSNVVAAFNLDAAIIAKIKQKYHKLNNSSSSGGGGSNNNTNSIKRSVFYPPSATETATKTTPTPTQTGNISQERIRTSQMLTTTLPTTTINTSTSKPSQAKQMTCIQETQETATLGDETTTTTSATANKSYGYTEICTNACKCQVDVLLIKDIDDLRHHPNNMKENESLRGGMISIITSTAITTPTSSSTLLAKATTPKAITTPSPSITQQFLEIDRKPPISTIQIKNCDCNSLLAKNNETNSRLRDGSVSIQNKSYYNFAKQKRKISIVAPPLKKKKSNVGVEVKIDQNNVDDGQKDSDDGSVAVATAGAPSINADGRDDFIGSVKREPLTAADLLDIAKQVAIGMEFLAKNKVVHRDLAARNVLVAPDRTIKIADFGLSRDVYQENIYKKMGNGKLPIKWLALESMTHQVYTTQSDVWSYGILLYEIVTLGGSPYPAIPTNRLLHLLKSGYRMEKPKNCGPEFYNLMYSCWALNPAERPNFTQIIKKLEDLMNETTTSEGQVECLIGPKGQKSPQEITSDDAYLKPL